MDSSIRMYFHVIRTNPPTREDFRLSMAAFYELLDTEPGNLIGTYASEAEALAVVRHAARIDGPAYVGALALGYEEDDGGGGQLAAGAELLPRAMLADPERLSRPV